MSQAKKYAEEHSAELRAKYDAVPEYDDGFADWVKDNGIKPVARGFAAFKEYINKKGRPASEDPKDLVSIRLQVSVLTHLRATGRGWQTRLGDYVARGIKRGAFGAIAA
jgi:uncharacterized protein (DUF4415 family)